MRTQDWDSAQTRTLTCSSYNISHYGIIPRLLKIIIWMCLVRLLPGSAWWPSAKLTAPTAPATAFTQRNGTLQAQMLHGRG
jgi:hypothetical protein